MAEKDSTTIIEGEEPQGRLWKKLFRIQGLADILYYAANCNEELSSVSVEEVAMQIDDLAREAMDVLNDLTDKKLKTTAGEIPEAPLPIELQ
ncbi:MAG: hypothetical protein WCD80_08555 [Desulfobaccales bacterium]